MSQQCYPFAVRLIGFTAPEEMLFEAACANESGKRYAYFRLADDNLQDPDIYLANADDQKGLAALPSLHPGPMRPALLAGTAGLDLPPFPVVERPIDSSAVFAALDQLVEKRADALARLQASDVVVVPERRRRIRVDDGRDPAEYDRMRVKRPERGAVLVVDKTNAFRDYLAELLARYGIPVMWVDNEVRAVEVCRQETVAVVMINTSTQEVDPYRLCWAIKEKDAPLKMAVVFLIGNAAEYDIQQAGYVSADGYLIKPALPQHLLSALKKFMPLR